MIKASTLSGSIHYDDDQNSSGYGMHSGTDSRWYSESGDGIMFGSFTKSLDVIGHGLTHGVSQYTASLPYHWQSGH